MTTSSPGFPPKEVTSLLRIEGAAVFAATLIAYQATGGNWWLFAALLLAPDLSFFGVLAGEKIGARIYNLAHTYTVPAVLGTAGWFGGMGLLVPVAIIWAAHIGMDRAFGYGLKYPGHDHHTHLGLIGKAKRRQHHANPA